MPGIDLALPPNRVRTMQPVQEAEYPEKSGRSGDRKGILFSISRQPIKLELPPVMKIMRLGA